MLPDVNALIERTLTARNKIYIEKKNLANEFINLVSINEAILVRANCGFFSVELRIPSKFMIAKSEIEQMFKNAGYELLTPSAQNMIKITWEKEELA